MIHLLLAVIYLSFISLGLPDSLLGSAWPVMHIQLGTPMSWAGIVAGIISIGTVVSSLQSDRLTRRLGPGVVTAFSVGMTAAALFGFSFSTSFWMLCLWAVPYGLGAGSVDVAALTPDRVERLRAVFWDMCTLSSSVETIEHAATDDTEAWTEKKLHITITPKSADDMRTAYAFSTDQSNTLSELLGELDVLGGLLANLGISDEKVIEVLQRLPDDLSPERRAVVETACKLVGKINSFWGGKSSAIGWDPRWGTLMKVTAPGNDTSGTYRPFGLDCSGFLDWVLKNVGLPSDGHWYIGRNLTALSTADAKPGDFALYPDSSHIGVVVGRNEAGKLLICHCASGQNNIVITEFSVSGFTAVGKLAFMD